MFWYMDNLIEIIWLNFFLEKLKGFIFTENGDISRIINMIVKCIICFAKSKTDKLMKGLLTGPVTTILLYSFFSRNDQPIYI
ncbi:hypothetical protein [Blattabacterium punctulatus]|uniref:hypothetical protein n=1 Tax=Blattabacterium punctulatus TaxID=164514 RepID=UPI001F29F7F3|nr:hypothetical protein [Blattabacterium punctulatus]